MTLIYKADYKSEFPSPRRYLSLFLAFIILFCLLLVATSLGFGRFSENPISEKIIEFLISSIIILFIVLMLILPIIGTTDEIHSEGIRFRYATIFDYLLNKGMIFKFENIISVELLSYYTENDYHLIALTFRCWSNKQLIIFRDMIKNDFFSRFIDEMNKRKIKIIKRKYVAINILGFKNRCIYIN